MNSHQIAKAAVAKMAVIAIEINSESAASLIQSLTVARAPSARLPGSKCVAILFVKLWPFARHAIAIFHSCVSVDRHLRWWKARGFDSGKEDSDGGSTT